MQIESLQAQVEIPREFILPGDTPGSAALDLARTIVRRAERRIAELMARGDLANRDLLPFVNRLSSYLFLLEIAETAASGREYPTLAKEK
jgi:cob(I)alamin adenosyltransferase